MCLNNILGNGAGNMSARVATWERVSSDGQDVANQTATLARHCDGNGYEVVKRFTLPDTSAFKGRHQAALDEITRDIAAGEYTRVIAVTSSRFERRGVAVGLTFILRLAELGARLEVTDNPLFGDVSNLGGWITTVASGDADNSYSQKISDNVNRAFRRMDDAGSFRGCPPVGYLVTGEKYAKVLAIDPEWSADVIRAFNSATTGTATPELGQRLGMTADAVAKMLRSKVYSTGRYEVHRADGVTAVHHCQALVTVAVQGAAIAAMEARRTGDNVTPRGTGKDDFSTALWCRCGHPHPLLRYYGGGRPMKDGTPTDRVRRYRCNKTSGGCGKSVNADNADAAVHELMSARRDWWLSRELIPGDDHADELDRVALELRELPARGLDDDAEDAERARLRSERKRLEALPSVPARWEQGFKQDAAGSNLTEADRWASLDSAGRRRWLASGEFRIFATAAPGRTGKVAVELIFMNVDDD